MSQTSSGDKAGGSQTAPQNNNDRNTAADDLLSSPLAVINVGLAGFAEELSAQSIPVVNLDWRPPADGDASLARLLSKLGS